MLPPSRTAMVPEGEIDPPAEADAVTECLSSVERRSTIPISIESVMSVTVKMLDGEICIPSTAIRLMLYPSLRWISTVSEPPYATRTLPLGSTYP